MSEYNRTHMADKKTEKKSKQEVGNLRFVVFELTPIEYTVGWILVMLHFLRLPLDVNCL